MRERYLTAGVLIFLIACSTGTGTDSGDSAKVARMALPTAELEPHIALIHKADAITDSTERCLAYPDLPGNTWLPGAAEARCYLFAKPDPTLLQIEEMLVRKGGEVSLEHLYAKILDEDYQDALHRERIFAAFQAFDSSDDARRVAELWVDRAPQSAFALTALAHQRLASAWAFRGEDYVRDTPDKNLATMERLVAQAIPMYAQALSINPRVTPACVGMIDIGMLTGSHSVRQHGTSACEKADPASWHVMRIRLSSSLPKWGGSREELHTTVEVARSLAHGNPALGGFLAKEIGLDTDPLVRAHRWAEAAPILEKAAQLAPDPVYIGDAARAANKMGESRKAFVYISQALRLAPDDHSLLGLRSAIRSKLGDFTGAAIDAERAIALDSDNGYYHSLLGTSKQKLGLTDEASRAFHVAMQDHEQRRWAFERWCELKIVPQVMAEEALACTAGLASEYPDDAKVLFMRAWVLKETHDPAAAQMADRFFSVVDQGNATHASMVSQLRERMARD